MHRTTHTCIHHTYRSWVPIHLTRTNTPHTQVHYQAEDRVHRIGQPKPVHIFYLDAIDTFDQVLKKLHEVRYINIDSKIHYLMGAIDTFRSINYLLTISIIY